MNKKLLDIVKELHEYDHSFLTEKGALEFSEPFGFKVRCYDAVADGDRNPKGLTLNDGAKSAVGICASDLAEQICEHLKLPVNHNLMGRGFRLRSALDTIKTHLERKES